MSGPPATSTASFLTSNRCVQRPAAPGDLQLLRPPPATARFRALLEEAHRLAHCRTQPAARRGRQDRRRDTGDRRLGMDCQAVPIVHRPQRAPLPVKILRVPVQVAHDPGLPHLVQPAADPSGGGVDPGRLLLHVEIRVPIRGRPEAAAIVAPPHPGGRRRQSRPREGSGEGDQLGETRRTAEASPRRVAVRHRRREGLGRRGEGSSRRGSGERFRTSSRRVSWTAPHPRFGSRYRGHVPPPKPATRRPFSNTMPPGRAGGMVDAAVSKAGAASLWTRLDA